MPYKNQKRTNLGEMSLKFFWQTGNHAIFISLDPKIMIFLAFQHLTCCQLDAGSSCKVKSNCLLHEMGRVGALSDSRNKAKLGQRMHFIDLHIGQGKISRARNWATWSKTNICYSSKIARRKLRIVIWRCWQKLTEVDRSQINNVSEPSALG